LEKGSGRASSEPEKGGGRLAGGGEGEGGRSGLCVGGEQKRKKQTGMFNNQWQVGNSLSQKQLKTRSEVLLALLKFVLEQKLILTLTFGDSYPFS
jgi:hypothetical protein